MSSRRPFIIAANWKLNKSPRESVEFLQDFVQKVEAQKLLERAVSPSAFQREIVFFIPAISLWVSEQALRGSDIGCGAQNIYFENKGAFTGENSPAIVKEIGATHALVGHSERRAIFGESDELVSRKVRAIQGAGLKAMICVGESLSERESGKTDQVIVHQLREALRSADLKSNLSIAYEPVWAIGTGKVASPEQANQAHLVLRQALREIGGEELAGRTPILYGGSVKPENANEIANQSEVDGFLVGGASLEVESFLRLCETQKGN